MMGPRLLLALAAGLCCAAPLAAQERRGGGGRSYANPSAAIAAELAMAKDARLRGQWAALASAAAPEAVLFVPQIVWARPWLKEQGLKGRAGGVPAGTREPYEAWSSCDGSLVVNRGGWRREGAAGRFVTVWQRQPDGAYRWLVQQDLPPDLEGAAPDMIAAHVADCPERSARADGKGRPGKADKRQPANAKNRPPPDPTGRSGRAGDGSLAWELAVDGRGARRLIVRWKHEGAEETVLDAQAGG